MTCDRLTPLDATFLDQAISSKYVDLFEHLLSATSPTRGLGE